MAEVLWNKITAEVATLGQCKSFWEASGISFDTRKIKEGDLFIALPGKRDGHDFIKAAFDRGAAAAMVTNIPKGLDEEDRLLVVDDVMKALVRMAKPATNESKATFIELREHLERLQQRTWEVWCLRALEKHTFRKKVIITFWDVL